MRPALAGGTRKTAWKKGEAVGDVDRVEQASEPTEKAVLSPEGRRNPGDLSRE
jgi:hypothetical protein